MEIDFGNVLIDLQYRSVLISKLKLLLLYHYVVLNSSNRLSKTWHDASNVRYMGLSPHVGLHYDCSHLQSDCRLEATSACNHPVRYYY